MFELKQEVPIDIKCLKVKGHQDTTVLNGDLTLIETLNCEVDNSAKEFLDYVWCHKLQSNHKLYSSQWRLCRGGNHIYANLKQNITQICHSDSLIHHIMEKWGYSKEKIATINWDMIKMARKSSSTAERTWLTKQVGNYNPTGKQIIWRNYWTDSKCPWCNGLIKILNMSSCLLNQKQRNYIETSS